MFAHTEQFTQQNKFANRQVKHTSQSRKLDILDLKFDELPLEKTRGVDSLSRSLRFQSDLAIILGRGGTDTVGSGDGSGAFSCGSGASTCVSTIANGTGVTGANGVGIDVAGVCADVTGVNGVGIDVAGVCADEVRTLGDSSVIGTDEGGAVEGGVVEVGVVEAGVGAGASVGVLRTMAPLSCVLLGGDSGGVGDLLFLLFGKVLSSLATDAESAKYPRV
jgi:hypothetical protein